MTRPLAFFRFKGTLLLAKLELGASHGSGNKKVVIEEKVSLIEEKKSRELKFMVTW